MQKNCTEIVAHLNYVKEVFDLRYRLTTDNITRSKDKDKI